MTAARKKELDKMLAKAKAKCELALEELADEFMPWHMLTLIVRNRKDPDEDMVLSEDDLSKVAETVYELFQKHCLHTAITDTNPAFCSNCGLEMSYMLTPPHPIR